MPDFTLRLSDFDLSPYIRAGSDDQFSPTGDGSFMQPQFAENPYAEGAQLSSVTVGNRELAIPLYVKAGKNAGLTNIIYDPRFEAYPTTAWSVGLSSCTDLGSGRYHLGKLLGRNAWAYRVYVQKDANTNARAPGLTMTADAANLSPALPNVTYTFAADVYVATLGADPRVRLMVTNYDSSVSVLGAQNGSTQNMVLGWNRIVTSFTMAASTAYVRLNVQAVTAVSGDILDYYYTNIIGVVGSYTNSTMPQYFDGDSPGAIWTGNRSASTSTQISLAGGVQRLVQKINKILRPLIEGTAPTPVQLVWQDIRSFQSVGTDAPMFYDVVFGRLEPAWSLRQTENGILAGTLHLHVKPYGHTGTLRITDPSSIGVIHEGVNLPGAHIKSHVYIVPSGVSASIGGDTPADIRIEHGNTGEPHAGRISIFSVLPASYNPVFTALPFSSPIPSYITPADPFTYTSPFCANLRFDAGPVEGVLHAGVGSIMRGRNRVILLSRGGCEVQLTNLDGKPASVATTIATNVPNWGFVDLGVVEVPNWVPTVTLPLRFNPARRVSLAASNAFWDNALTLRGEASNGGGNMQIAALYVIPEKYTLMHVESDIQTHHSRSFWNVGSALVPANTMTDVSGASYAVFTSATTAPFHSNVVDRLSITGGATNEGFGLSIASQPATYLLMGIAGMGSMPNLRERYGLVEAQFALNDLGPMSGSGIALMVGWTHEGLMPQVASWSASGFLGRASSMTNGVFAMYRTLPSHGVFVHTAGGSQFFPLNATTFPYFEQCIRLGIETTPSNAVAVSIQFSQYGGSIFAPTSVNPEVGFRFVTNSTPMAYLASAMASRLTLYPYAALRATSIGSIGLSVVASSYQPPGITDLRYTSWPSVGIGVGDTIVVDHTLNRQIRVNGASVPLRDLQYAARGELSRLMPPDAGGGILALTHAADYGTTGTNTTSIRVRERFTYLR